ncbi:MAG: nucleotide exchange factor GrpE [Nitrospiraceae bacterium]
MDEKEEHTNTFSKLEPTSEDRPTTDRGKPGSDEEVEQALAAKDEEAKALQDKYLRLAAEFENFKRLTQRDQREYYRFANESLLKELLPIIDNLERAIRSSKERPGNDGLIQGVELVLKQCLETLAKFGVRPMNSVGEPFDPSRHQAVAHVESEDASGKIVVEEYQRGYLLHDRILRAAMVAVADVPTRAGREGGKASLSADESPVDTE